MEYVIFLAAMAAGFFAAQVKLYLLSGIVLMAAAVLLYILFYKRSGMLLDPAALFSVSWIGGMGVSALKLSRLQTDWEPVTWLCFAAAWLCFTTAFRAAKNRCPEKSQKREEENAGSLFQQEENAGALSRQAEKILRCLVALTGISLGAFLLEALVLGYVPLFTVDTPHAYSYFHISGVHYFTVSCVLVPPLFVLYLDMLVRHCRRSCPGTAEEKELAVLLRCGGLGYGPRMFLAAACTAAALCIPLLCVSRFQLIFALLLGAFTKLSLPGGGRPGKRLILGAGILLLCLIPLYIGLTVARAHDVAYLNGIFEMKDPGTPIFFTQPYMYVANNFDNFNCLVRELPAGGHTLGLRMLFPLWALTGLKFLFPQLVSFPLYVTKTELTTVTLFYDAYYDFGLLGVALLGLLLGAAYGIFLKKTGLFQRERPLGIRGTGLCLIYAQLAFYLLFSFFTTWFSNPTTWFYLAVSLVICIYIGKENPR